VLNGSGCVPCTQDRQTHTLEALNHFGIRGQAGSKRVKAHGGITKTGIRPDADLVCAAHHVLKAFRFNLTDHLEQQIIGMRDGPQIIGMRDGPQIIGMHD
jgi:hypothetical protein